MMNAWFARLILCLLFSGSSLAETYEIHEVDTGAFFGKGRVHWVKFKAEQFQLRVVDNGSMRQPRYPDLRRAIAGEGGVAGINGGFFAREGYPLGLVMHAGKRLGKVSHASSLVSGVVYESESGPGLMRSKLFKKQQRKLAGLSEALQGGPFLLEGGREVRGLDTGKPRRRSFVATDGEGTWVIGCCTPVSLAGLAKLLRNERDLGGFRARTALNLDGGSSSCLVWNGAWKMRNSKAVRNYLVLVRR